jgi:hypothetical protein
MHRHKIVAQILLILSVLNSVLAAPAVSVREMHEARRALAVRVPAEGAVAVLQKRPYPLPPPPSPESESNAFGQSPEHPLPPLPPPESESNALGQSPEHQLPPPPPPESNALGHSPEHPVPQEDYHDASTVLKPQAGSSRPSAWKPEKIMTPEKIKAVKYVGIAGLATIAYMSLLFPEIFNGQNSSQS